MSILLSSKSHWANELKVRSSRAKIAEEFLKIDDIATLSDILIIGSTISRRLLEEGKHGAAARDLGEYHFASSTCLKLDKLRRKNVNLKGCLELKDPQKPKIGPKRPQFSVNGHKTLTYYDLFSQILHSDPLQLWKSPISESPCFYVASTEHSSTKQLFYRVSWQDYANILDEISNTLIEE
ncbi:hypothetical protein [Pacificibacter sp. AS14]|uniref:hypothetical protein n=1 Tax=Pacificibacter sp. AS14 TaxID=3135785 RepID=UPI00317D983A